MRPAPAPPRGFTLTEILIALAIVAILISIGSGSYQRYKDKARVMQAVGDVGMMSLAVQGYMFDNGSPPVSLAAVGHGNRLDPWGNPYQYFNLQTRKGNGQARKDKKLAPLNSDFDLYSMGKDGQSQGPLNAKASRDDIVRARDGKFVGLAEEFDP